MIGGNDGSGPFVRAAFAQRTYRAEFSDEGTSARRSVDDVAAALLVGDLRLDDVPVRCIVRHGHTLILNTRSAVALELAGVPRAEWRGLDCTGQPLYEELLSGQLRRNRLSTEGIMTVRRSGTSR